MQNLFTSEHQARIIIDTRRDEARHQDLLALARAGRPVRERGATVVERASATIRRVRLTSPEPACRPGMAC